MHHIQFLNHSSLILNSQQTKILCDPWFKGTAFGDGWSLLHDHSHNINDLEFDYIWISHEHPDHFSISTLNDLDRECVFLFQETKDKKVKKYLEKKGHTVIELKNKQKYKFSDIELTCIVCDGYDSSLLTKFPDNTLALNINDARVELYGHLEKELVPLLDGEHLDLLAFQFSYASWAGNKGDDLIPTFLQHVTDEKNKHAISKLKPKAAMLFASFIYFSHSENFYWNEYNWYNHIFKKFENENTKIIFPMPNQHISLSDIEENDWTCDNKLALDFWTNKHQSITVKTRTCHAELEEIENNYYAFVDTLKSRNSIFNFIGEEKNFIVSIHVNDLDITLELGLIHHHFKTKNHEENACGSVSSETLIFLFKQLFARGTVSVNGRIEFNYNLAHMFFLFFFIPYANNIGIYFSKINTLNAEMLNSIKNQPIIQSILQFNKEADKFFTEDINLFNSIFQISDIQNTDYEIFNDEPQNDQMENQN